MPNPPAHHPTLFDPTPTPEPLRSCHPTLASDFDRFWQAYPRKVGKGEAQRAFFGGGRKSRTAGALQRAGSVDRMLDTIAVWMTEWRNQPQFCPHPATWLNRDGWCDDPPVRRVEQRRLSSRESAFASMMARNRGVAG